MVILVKKKIFIFFLIFIFIITGCNESEKEENDTENVEKVLKEYEEEQKEELNIEDIKVKSLIATSKKYAIVKDDNNEVFIINSDNILEGIIENSNDSSVYQINDNGYVYQNINGSEYIYNKSGKKIFSTENDTKYYYGIAENNYLIRRVNSNKNALKEEYSYEVIDVNNKTIIDDLKKEIGIKEKGPISIIYLGGNIYVITSKEQEYLYNIKTNKSIAVEELNYSECSSKITETNNYEKCYENIDNMIRINNKKTLIKDDLSIINLSKYDILIDDNYYYSESEKRVKGFDGTVIKDMSIYPLVDAIKIDNLYYLATTKGLMTLDKNFNEVGEIKQLGKSIKKLTEYGIIVNKNTDKRASIIYDYDMKVKKDLDNLYLYDVQDFVSKVFIDGEDNNLLPFNIKENKTIEVNNK